MTGLMQRLLRRRPSRSEPGEEQPTQQLPATGPAAEEFAAPPAQGFRDRGRLRRRLRYLRRARELGFRDLGGLVFDLHRFERERPDLVRTKLDALRNVDHELRALEVALDDRRSLHELREPGISACPRCGVLHGSDANFCPACGTAVSDSRAVGERVVGEMGTLESGPSAPDADAQPSDGHADGAATHAGGPDEHHHAARDELTHGATDERSRGTG